MNGKPWSAEDERVLRRLYPCHDTDYVAGQLDRSLSATYGHAGVLGLHKTAAFLAAQLARVAANLTEGGKRHRFPKGHAPANKGLRRPGWSAGRMRETQFRKGQRSGTAAAHYMPVGSERMIDGYRWIKVAEVPNVPYTVNWKALHVLNWERANGRPLPAGHCLIFRDRDRMNVAADNLECVTRAENMRRNSYHRYPKEIASVIQLRGALVRRINRKIKQEGPAK